MTLADAARRAIPLLDLTVLGEHDDRAAVSALCARATRAGVAAVCVWPRFTAQCRQALHGTGVRVATVANFPAGDGTIADVTGEVKQALDEGAQEIDLVLPVARWLAGERAYARELIASGRQACGQSIRLKVILETGRLRTLLRITDASRDAILAGADFLKTSTGKIRVSATPTAASVMLGVIRDADRAVGFKASGGIRTTRQAAAYLRLADRIMGPGWATPATFRFGASSLLADLERTLVAELS